MQSSLGEHLNSSMNEPPCSRSLLEIFEAQRPKSEAGNSLHRRREDQRGGHHGGDPSAEGERES